MPSMSEWYDMRTDAERLKCLYESLDTIWAGLEVGKTDDGGSTAEEFIELLNTLARGAQSSEMWATVARWAGEKA